MNDTRMCAFCPVILHTACMTTRQKGKYRRWCCPKCAAKRPDLLGPNGEFRVLKRRPVRADHA